MEIITGIILLIGLLVLGVKVPFCFGATIIWYVYSLKLGTSWIISNGYAKVNSILLLSIPMFILAGGIMEKGKLSDVLIGFIEKFVGWIKGSLAIIVIVASAAFGAVSGSGAATLSCIGSIMSPRMKKSGYSDGHIAAVIACSAPLGLLIPPSGLMIVFAWTAGQSVLACFLSTLIPGIILTVLLCIVNYFMLRNNNKIIVTQKETFKKWSMNLGHRTIIAFPALLMPVIILGGIYGGIMTPTESAAISVMYAFLVTLLIYKDIKIQNIKDTFTSTATTTGVIMISLFTCTLLGKVFVLANLPNIMMKTMLSISDNNHIILFMINIFLIIIGMLMDDISGILLCTPILMPIALKIGIHPIHFAAIMGVNMGLANITPPSAPFLYLGARLVKCNVSPMLMPVVLMIIFAWVPTLIITTLFPEISLYLPRLILGTRF